MNFTDTERLNFLEKWETSSHRDSWFTLLTQHVSKQNYPTLRDFCDYSIDFEKMIDENSLDILGWHSMIPELQQKVIFIWKEECRVMNAEEKDSLLHESNKYWEELHKIESQDQDK